MPTSCNTESAFGLPFGNVIISVAVLAIIAFVFLKNRMPGNSLSLALIIGGGISNLLDRVLRGCVLDFIDLKFWPSFNLADSAITIGVVLLGYNVLFKKEKV